MTLSQVFFKIPSGPRGNLPYTNWYGEILFVLFIVSRYAHRTKGSLLSHSFGNFVLTKWCSIFLKVEFQRSTPAFPSGCKGVTLLISMPSLRYTSSFNPEIKLVALSFCIINGKPTLVKTPIKASHASFAVRVRNGISSGHLLKLQTTHITYLCPLEDVGIMGPTKSTEI